MKKEEALAIFTLAQIPVKTIYETANGYDHDRSDPWWLVQTDAGIIIIGWRNRVTNIDWSGTHARGIVTIDDVTKDETHVHAWSYAKAVEYMASLKKLFVQEGKSHE